MKVRTSLIISAMCFAIIPMIIYAVFAGIKITENGNEEFRRQLSDIIKNQANTLEIYQETVNKQLETLASLESVKEASKGDIIPEKLLYLDDLLKRLSSEDPSVNAALLVDMEGRVICGEGMGTIIKDFYKYRDYKDNVLYIDVINSIIGNAENSKMFVKRKIGSSTLIIYYNITPNTFISKISDNSTFYNQGRVIIVDSMGNWTSGAGHNINLDDQYPKSVTEKIPFLIDEVPSEIIQYEAYGRNIGDTKAVAQMIRVGGEDGLVALASCPESRSSIFSNPSVSLIVVIIVLIALASTGAAVLFAFSATKPLRAIENTLVKLRRGDHEARINNPGSNEYGQLARAFNDLVDAIVLSEERYRTITDMSDNVIFEWNFNTNEVFFSNNFNKFFSYRAPSDHFGDCFLLKAKVHPQDAARYKEDLERLGKGEELVHNEYRIKNVYGDFLWFLIRTATLRDKFGNPVKVVGVMVDIDRAKKSEQLLTARANFDALTELYNRETLEDELNNEISMSETRKAQLAVLFIDVDDFKHYNDQYSHATGDMVLKFVARTIRDTIKEYGFAGRYGGDEFIACVRNSEINDPTKTAGDIISKLDEGFVCDTGEILRVSVSIGISVIKEDYGVNVDLIIGKADDAMYSVKKNGKSNFAFIP